MIFKDWIESALVLCGLSLALAGCSSNLESSPVSLPVPFSGALSANARVAVADGFPLHQTDFLGHPSGDEWEIFDSEGNAVGVVLYTLNAAQAIPKANQNNIFGMRISVVFDDGSTATSDNVQFFDFPFDIAPSFDVAIAVPDEPGARVIATKGTASGTITEGMGLFANAIGETMDLRYVYESILHEDGTMTFFKINKGTWILHF